MIKISTLKLLINYHQNHLESLVVSCGSNGELHKLKIAESKIYLDYTNKFHDRTINKIHFHPHEPNILISGGQDGIIKLIDFRCIDSGPVSSIKFCIFIFIKINILHDFDRKKCLNMILMIK